MLISTHIYNSKVAVCEAVDASQKNPNQKKQQRLNTKAVITYW